MGLFGSVAAVFGNGGLFCYLVLFVGHFLVALVWVALFRWFCVGFCFLLVVCLDLV